MGYRKDENDDSRPKLVVSRGEGAYMGFPLSNGFGFISKS